MDMLEKIIIESTVDVDHIYPFWQFAPQSETIETSIDPLMTFITSAKIDREYICDIIKVWRDRPEKVEALPVHAFEFTATPADKAVYYVGDNGNHLVTAARFLRKKHLRAEVQNVDYRLLPITWGLWHDKKLGWFCVPQNTSLNQRTYTLYKIPDKTMLKRLCELGFKEGW